MAISIFSLSFVDDGNRLKNNSRKPIFEVITIPNQKNIIADRQLHLQLHMNRVRIPLWKSSRQISRQIDRFSSLELNKYWSIRSSTKNSFLLATSNLIQITRLKQKFNFLTRKSIKFDNRSN